MYLCHRETQVSTFLEQETFRLKDQALKYKAIPQALMDQKEDLKETFQARMLMYQMVNYKAIEQQLTHLQES